MTYGGAHNDVKPLDEKGVIVLGSGPYRIGSSVEFDWTSVNTAMHLKEHGKKSIIVNCNPETVSTDYDISDRLYFEELTFERIADIYDFEASLGIIVSVGGQTPNNRAQSLYQYGAHILGTTPENITKAEDRSTFSKLLDDLAIDQPKWDKFTDTKQAIAFADAVGYPVLIRPSFVLSGTLMRICNTRDDLIKFLDEAARISKEYPLTVSKFIEQAKEIEFDAVVQKGEVKAFVISEHIENAGVHSGDASIVLPPQKINATTQKAIEDVGQKLAKALEISGPVNIQFLAKDNNVQVIETNLRASRTFPFISKVTGINFVKLMVDAFFGTDIKAVATPKRNFVAVKVAQFSFARLTGSDPILHVEMASTGEVAVIGRDIREAFWLAWRATEQSVNGKRILISIGSNEKKEKFIPLVHTLEAKGWEIFATEGTHAEFAEHGIGSTCVFKSSELSEPNVATLITKKDIDLIINIPNSHKRSTITDGFTLRRLAIDHRIPLITNSQDAELILTCLTELDESRIPMLSWKELMHYTYENDLET
jgi:carbamoyl-phosphate synthase large subunit